MLVSGERKQWIQRFDVAKLLEKSVDLSYWKGDEQTKGVFFTDEYGYTLNKILAIRVKHDEKAPEVFYSFTAKNEEESVITEYPFKELSLKPKNHHLLFDELKLNKDKLDDIFRVPDTYESITIETDRLVGLLEKVNNKRELERSYLVFGLQENQMKFDIVRKKKKDRIVTFGEVINCKPITAADVIAAQKRMVEKPVEKPADKRKDGAVNAHTMLYVLKIFSAYSSILFKVGNGRIMITGDKQKEIEVPSPITEVVIALTKNY